METFNLVLIPKTEATPFNIKDIDLITVIIRCNNMLRNLDVILSLLPIVTRLFRIEFSEKLPLEK